MKIKPLAAAIASLSFSTFAFAAYDDEGTEYSTDSQERHIWNEALEPLELVNGILCFTDQMRVTEFVNAGPYLVLADDKRCFESDSDDSGQASGAANTPSYIEVVVEATRGSDLEPLNISAWIPEMNEGEDQQAIRFKAVISEGASDENPFGQFTFNFDFFNTIEDTERRGGGELKTVNDLDGFIGFTLYEGDNRDGTPSSQSASVVMTADKTQGVALTAQQWGQWGGAHALAFNQSNVLVQSAESSEELAFQSGDNSGDCLSRTEFDDSVWRYDLYNSSTGDRVDINSGFPIKYDGNDDGVNDSHGYVSYWGLWTDGDVVLENGATVERFDYETESSTNYTLVRAPGRLIRNSAETLSLAETRGIQFSYWNDSAYQAGFDHLLVNYRDAELDGVSTSGFYIMGGLMHTENGEQIEEMPPEFIELQEFETLYMHSNQLGGEVKYVSGSTNITFFQQEYVNGSNFEGDDLSLVCFDRCLAGSISSDRLQNFDGPSSPYEAMVQSLEQGYSYSFAKTGSAALTLVNGQGAAVAFDSTVTEQTLQNSPHYWGVRSGPMVTAEVAAQLTNTWEVYDSEIVSTFYVWETGLQEWNQLTALRDQTGAFVSFDKPIQLRYTHSDSNDRTGDAGNFDGQVMMLNYGGNGDLWGIPNNQDEEGRQFPMFNLADGTLLGGENQFVVKAREIEQRMAASPGQCGSMEIDEPAAPVPTSTTGSADIGAMPEVSDAPSVIAGVIQQSEE